MKEISIYLTPVNKSLHSDTEKDSTWKNNIGIYKDAFPDLSKTKDCILWGKRIQRK